MNDDGVDVVLCVICFILGTIVSAFGVSDYTDAREWNTAAQWCEKHGEEIKRLGIDFDIHGKDFLDLNYTVICTTKEFQMNSRGFFMYEEKVNG